MAQNVLHWHKLELDFTSKLMLKALISIPHLKNKYHKKKIYCCGLVSETAGNLKQLKMSSF